MFNARSINIQIVNSLICLKLHHSLRTRWKSLSSETYVVHTYKKICDVLKIDLCQIEVLAFPGCQSTDLQMVINRLFECYQQVSVSPVFFWGGGECPEVRRSINAIYLLLFTLRRQFIKLSVFVLFLFHDMKFELINHT